MATAREDISDFSDDLLSRKATARYSTVSESIRGSIPESQMCMMFCGGKNCKYEGITKWKDRQAIAGLYSSWVTQNILAMSRPNTTMITKYDIIQQFKENNINSLVNLQMLAEHEHCGPGLESSGFTYQPQQFMDAQISFYNYGWRDYGVGSIRNLLDVVQVMQFATSEGKIAIHCHAGLGRTGVLIACYLVYVNRIQPQIAINYVRSKRPGSIQSNSQLQCIDNFHKFLLPMRIIFNISQDSNSSPFSLPQFVSRQRCLVHGKESKQLKYLPKLIFVCCNRLMELAGRLCKKEDHIMKRSVVDYNLKSEFKKNSHDKITPSFRNESPSNGLITTRSEIVTSSISMESFSPIPLSNKIPSSPNLPMSTRSSSSGHGKLNPRKLSLKDEPMSWISVVKAMSKTQYDDAVLETVQNLKVNLNSNDLGWLELEQEDNPEVISCLLWDWIDSLKEPILTHQDLPFLVDEVTDFKEKLSHLEKCTSQTIFYLVFTSMSLRPPANSKTDEALPINIHFQLMQRLISTLAHQNCVLERSDVTNDLDDGFFMRTSNRLGSVMRLDLGKKIYNFLNHFSNYILQSGMLCDCSLKPVKSSHDRKYSKFK